MLGFIGTSPALSLVTCIYLWGTGIVFIFGGKYRRKALFTFLSDESGKLLVVYLVVLLMTMNTG